MPDPRRPVFEYLRQKQAARSMARPSTPTSGPLPKQGGPAKGDPTTGGPGRQSSEHAPPASPPGAAGDASPSDAEAEAIRLRMQDVRRQLHDDVVVVREQVSDAFDWRTYVERYPLVTVGAAAALGYFLMPKRRPTPRVELTDSQFDKLHKKGKITVENAATTSSGGSTSDSDSGKSSAVKSAIAAAGAVALRAAVGHVVGHVTERYAAKQAGDDSSASGGPGAADAGFAQTPQHGRRF
ncbi:hypothetical protein Mal64_14980 [Pseudobythopirellula maris]|uniref:DUF3618 domain-containing protein n=1 Tax=Pseudobythopirellula maris TaxID=2527991 RepID=A0A5C5ZUM0_9BACT|nr:hypothetical protein [Pseudobythopirellula maris]TWT91099.1 hypothetical protein Mal64_14980 [Pseudobythopirellula maris]